MTNWRVPSELPDLTRVDNNLVAIDTETNDEGLRADRGSSWPWHGGWVCGIPVAWRKGGTMHAIYIPLRHPETNNFDPPQVARWLQDQIAAGVKFVTLNGPYDWGWLGADLGIKMPPSAQLEEVGVLAALADENQFRYSLDALCERYNLPGKDMTRLEEACKAAGFKLTKNNPAQSHIWQLPAAVCAEYGEADPIGTLLLFETLMPIIMREGTYAHYRLEVDLMPLTIAMRRKGVRIDQDAAEQARDLFLGKRDAALKELSEQYGAPLSMDEINSPIWKTATFEKYDILSPRKTPTGRPSFAAGNSGWMGGHEHWLPRLIAVASRYDATACKFLQGHIIDHIINGRIHAEINQFKSEDGGTKSVRMSVAHPPLQQMPIRDEETGPPIRKCFLPEESEFWAKTDVSQQEFRELVHFAEQHGLPRAKEAGDNYRSNRDADYHEFVAGITELKRKIAKPINFMKIYGGGAAAIALKAGLSLEKAQEAMAQYDTAMPFVKKLGRIYQDEAERTGITTLYGGAKRHWNKYETRGKSDKKNGPCSLEEARLRTLDPEHPWYRKALYRAKTYTALNALIQGSSAVHTKQWMLACFREGIIPMLQVHDELAVSVSSRAQGELVARLGEEAVSLSVPMYIDLAFGKSWGDAEHKWEDIADEGGASFNGATIEPADATRCEIHIPPAAPEAITPIDPPAGEPPVPLYCLNGNIEFEPEPQAPGKGNGHDTSPPPDPPSTAIDDHLVWVTVFEDEFATSLKGYKPTLPAIAAHIRTTTAKTKGALPWIKLQKFGDKATVRNCLRNNDNVIEISGLEGEHDKGTLSFTEAIARLRAAGIRCLVYTSPSYVPVSKERWRVLVPTSGFLAPSFRVGLLARLNGILEGQLAPESFTLSQAYYYGSVDKNPDHQVVVLDGDFIDLRGDLAAGAIFKDGSKAGNTATAGTQTRTHAASEAAGERKPSEPWQDPITRILAGDRLHDSIRDLAAKLTAAGTDPAATANILRGLMEKSQAPRDARWQERYNDIERAVSSAGKYAPAPKVDLSNLFAHLRKQTPAPEPEPEAGSAGVDANQAFLDKVNEAFSDFGAWKSKVFLNQDTTWWGNARNETAIEIVIANRAAPDALAAALLLCKRCGVDPKALGYIPPPGGAGTGVDANETFIANVNEKFADRHLWVFKLFPDYMWGTQSAIDIVLANKAAPDALAAALWLCEALEQKIDPTTLGFVPPPGWKAPPGLIEAKPFVLRDPKTLTKRDWIYGTHLIRKFGSATFAPSGSGKSNLMIIEALAIATGRPLLGILPPKRARVWYWNGEDPYDELERRIGAACLHYGITAEELDGWLFVNSGRDQGSAVVIAKQERDGITVAIPVVEALVATIRACKIDVVMIDPFISSHQVPENDNNAIDTVAKTWTMIADFTNTAIDLAHHTRKTGGAAVTVEDGRGASALLSAVRPARVLNAMTEDEATKAGIGDGRRRYFKVEDGKNNLALPPDKLDWYRSESVHLGNGDPNDLADRGDDMGVITSWEWPAPAEVAPEDLEKVKEAIRAGEWRKSSSAAEWVGHAVAKALGMGDVRKKGLDRTKVTTLVNTWIYNEVLKVVVRSDKKRMAKEFVEVAEAAVAD